MTPQRSIEYLTGFLMGFFMGFGLNLFFPIFNFFCSLIGWSPLKVVWWMFIPLPLICGLFMSKTIADLHLEDY